MKQVAMAALWRDDIATVVPLCVGCTSILEFCGMLARRSEHPLNPRQPDCLFVLYEIKPPHTLAACQSIVADRHKGNLGENWGELLP
jgi:hypothetical protein